MSKYIEERKDKGFNYSNEPIQYNKIPKDKIGEALKDFSEGSVSLEKCLSVLWKKELFTIACCKETIYIRELIQAVCWVKLIFHLNRALIFLIICLKK